MKGSGIIGAYHARRVAPLMARALPLHQMVPGASFEGSVLVDEALPPSEVAQRIKEAMEPSKDTTGAALDHVYPVPGHPPMRMEPFDADFGVFVDQPRRPIFRDSSAPMPRDQVLAASNHIAAKWDKKTRELKKQERRWKQ